MNYNKLYDEQPIETDIVEDTVVVEETSTPQLGIVNTREVYIRSESSKESDPVGTVKEGDEVFIYGEENFFYKIETQDGKKGYVMKCFIDAA